MASGIGNRVKDAVASLNRRIGECSPVVRVLILIIGFAVTVTVFTLASRLILGDPTKTAAPWEVLSSMQQAADEREEEAQTNDGQVPAEGTSSGDDPSDPVAGEEDAGQGEADQEADNPVPPGTVWEVVATPDASLENGTPIYPAAVTLAWDVEAPCDEGRMRGCLVRWVSTNAGALDGTDVDLHVVSYMQATVDGEDTWVYAISTEDGAQRFLVCMEPSPSSAQATTNIVDDASWEAALAGDARGLHLGSGTDVRETEEG